MIVNKWSMLTLIFYYALAILGVTSIWKIQKSNNGLIYKRNDIYKVNSAAFIWFMLWTFFAVYRYISPQIGGTDAPSYIEYFETCLVSNQHPYSYRTEPLFRLFTKGIRLLGGDYHFYFFILYTVIVIGYILFLKQYTWHGICFIPIIAGLYSYIMSFNIVRNSFSIGLLWIGFYFLGKKKTKKAIFWSVSSVLMHTASIFYAPFFVFNWIVEKLKIKSFRKLVSICTVLMIFIDASCIFVRNLVLSGSLNGLFRKLGLGQPFDVYASEIYGTSFWWDFLHFRISRLQLILVVVLFVFITPIEKYVNSQGSEAIAKFDILKKMIAYDYTALPLVFWFSVWRGPLYFVLARTIMWGIIIAALLKKISQRSRNFMILITLIGASLFFCKEIYKYWEISKLTPYYLEPFGEIIELIKSLQ